MSKWIKPSGIDFETNDMPETIAYLESLGWKRVVEDEPVKEPEPEPETEPKPQVQTENESEPAATSITPSSPRPRGRPPKTPRNQ